MQHHLLPPVFCPLEIHSSLFLWCIRHGQFSAWSLVGESLGLRYPLHLSFLASLFPCWHLITGQGQSPLCLLLWAEHARKPSWPCPPGTQSLPSPWGQSASKATCCFEPGRNQTRYRHASGSTSRQGPYGESCHPTWTIPMVTTPHGSPCSSLSIHRSSRQPWKWQPPAELREWHRESQSAWSQAEFCFELWASSGMHTTSFTCFSGGNSKSDGALPCVVAQTSLLQAVVAKNARGYSSALQNRDAVWVSGMPEGDQACVDVSDQHRFDTDDIHRAKGFFSDPCPYTTSAELGPFPVFLWQLFSCKSYF